MKVQIIRITPDGTRSTTTVDQDRIKIGRAAGCAVQLSDLRVSLDHAEISRDGNRVKIAATSLAGIEVNQTPTQSASLKVGSVIEIGLNSLTIVRAPGCAFGIEVREATQKEREERPSTDRYQLGLADTSASPRRVGWILVAAVLLAFLLWPLAGSKIPGAKNAAESIGLAPESAWLTGTSSRAHAHIMDDCAACHSKPFAQASASLSPVGHAADAAADAIDGCMECHSNITNHSDASWYAAHDAADLSCNDCHREHNGPEGLIARHPADCVDCHAQPGDWPEANLTKITRFGGAHPQFTPTVWTNGALTEVELPYAAEQSGLIFDHDDHTAAAGIEGPDGNTEVLACADCHVPAPGGVGFAPVSMEASCERCHSLTFDVDEPDARLPHAAADLVRKSIEEHYARRALAGSETSAVTQEINPLRRRPGAAKRLTEQERATAMAWAKAEAEIVKRQVFSKNVCGVCHESTQTDSDGDAPGQWSVMPLHLPDTFMTGAIFSHDGHSSMACADCHATATSGSSSDLLLPPLENCQSCHNDWDARDSAPSACVDCHGFHPASTPINGMNAASAHGAAQ